MNRLLVRVFLLLAFLLRPRLLSATEPIFAFEPEGKPRRSGARE